MITHCNWLLVFPSMALYDPLGLNSRVIRRRPFVNLRTKIMSFSLNSIKPIDLFAANTQISFSPARPKWGAYDIVSNALTFRMSLYTGAKMLCKTLVGEEFMRAACY